MGLLSWLTGNKKIEQPQEVIEVPECCSGVISGEPIVYNYYKFGNESLKGAGVWRFKNDDERGEYINVINKETCTISWTPYPTSSQLHCYTEGLSISVEEAVNMVKKECVKPDRLIAKLFPEYKEPITYDKYKYYGQSHWLGRHLDTNSTNLEYINDTTNMWEESSYTVLDVKDLELCQNNAIDLVKSWQKENPIFNIEKLFVGYKDKPVVKTTKTPSKRKVAKNVKGKK